MIDMKWRVVLLVLAACGAVVAQNCRVEDQRVRACENVCDEHNVCKIRAALLLPRNTSYDASLRAVEPVLELALQSQAVREAFPSWLTFEWQSYDVEDCDAAHAVISAIDAYNDCAHVFLGPACDFALASVARITKFLGSTGGTPVLTTGGFSFDFVLPKQTCDDEFYTLVRTGPLGFKDMAYFIINIMRYYKWRQVLLITEPESQLSVAGKSTCHLMMKTLVNFLKLEDLMYIPWDTTSDGGKNYTENLKIYLDYKYTTEFAMEFFNSFDWGRVVLLYETPAYESNVGATGGFLLASSVHEFMVREGIEVLGRELQMQNSLDEQLLQIVGNNYASESPGCAAVWA